MKKYVELQTTAGNIRLELDEDKAPETVKNFLKYVNDGFYDGLIFHRVIKRFMIQGGGFAPGMKSKTASEPIKSEANNGLKNDAYTIAMARTSQPHSASSQFFINAVDNHFLDFNSEMPQGWGYTVFGKVTSGTDVVSQIEKVKTQRKGFHDDVPVEDIVITKAVELTNIG